MNRKSVTSRNLVVGAGLVPLYALICLASFLCCVVLLVILIENVGILSRYGLTTQVYYLVLVLMGLTAAGFLFGVMRSSSSYVGELWGRTLRLSGSIVGAALVVVGGYLFIPKATTFPLTAYVHGENGANDLVLRNSGQVFLKLGPEMQTKQIGENGSAFFPAIPSNFRGQEIEAWVESDGYKSPQTKVALSGSALELEVVKKLAYFKLAGTVLDPHGDPLSEVHVSVPEFHSQTQTTGDGRFEFRIQSNVQKSVDLVASKQAYKTGFFRPTLGDAEMSFTLARSR